MSGHKLRSYETRSTTIDYVMLPLLVAILCLLGAAEARYKCPKVAGMINFNFTEYTRGFGVSFAFPLEAYFSFDAASWYIHMQQVNAYQKPAELHCVVATYNHDNRSSVPFFSGAVVSVYNYANVGSVNGKAEGSPSGMVLCARMRNPNRYVVARSLVPSRHFFSRSPSELTVAPCFLPNFLGGPYWVVAAGPSADSYDWAIVSGGQPKKHYPDGCTLPRISE